MSILELERLCEAQVLAAVLRSYRRYGDLFSDCPIILPETGPVVHAGRITLERPCFRLAAFVLHVDEPIDMWVDPQDLGEHPGDRDLLIGVKLGCDGVVRERRLSYRQQRERSD